MYLFLKIIFSYFLFANGHNTLELVHIIFRHGARTTDTSITYPKDPHINETFYPYGPGQLTKEGKMTMYKLGKQLRERYHRFLGDTYIPEQLDAWCSVFGRSKMSLQLVLASLYPPKIDDALESCLQWQPVIFNYVPLEDDKIFGGTMINPNFLKLYNNYTVSPEGQNLLKKHANLLEYMRKHSGYEFKSTREAYRLHAALATEKEFGLRLPNWTNSIFPDKLRPLVTLEYHMQTATKELQRIVSGELLKKILLNSKQKAERISKYKLHLYSGHDTNIVNMLTTLELMPPHFAGYGACLIFELHNIRNTHFIKLRYKENEYKEFSTLKFPKGGMNCTLEDFQLIVDKVIEN